MAVVGDVLEVNVNSPLIPSQFLINLDQVRRLRNLYDPVVASLSNPTDEVIRLALIKADFRFRDRVPSTVPLVPSAR